MTNGLVCSNGLKSRAAKLGATAQDVCRVSRATTTVAVSILIPVWLTVLLNVTEDSQLLQALALATLIALGAFVSAWLVRAVSSKITRKGITIVMQTAALVGALAAFGIVMISGWRYQSEIRQTWSEAAKRKVEAERKRQAKEDLARKADEECGRRRDEEIDRAKAAQAAARKRLADCKADYAKQILPFKTADEHCRPALGKLSSAKGQLNVANSITCSTASISR